MPLIERQKKHRYYSGNETGLLTGLASLAKQLLWNVWVTYQKTNRGKTIFPALKPVKDRFP